MITFELIIFKNLFENKEYISKVLPFIKQIYFTVQRQDQRIIFKLLVNHVKKYKKIPLYSTIKTLLQKEEKLSETQFKEANELINEIETLQKEEWGFQWLLDETEIWCKTAALELAIIQGMDRIDKKEKLTEIPELMKKALSIDFNVTLGLDYFSEEEINNRWERYHVKHEKIPSKIGGLESITNGGVERKTLNVLMGDTGVGKTSSLVSLACDYVENGYKVIYFSFEMDEYKICHRVDAHFLQTPINEIEFLDEAHYKTTLQNLGYGEALIVKEYGEGCATIFDIKLMLDDLKLKKDFVPDVVMIDYINIMDSIRCTKQVGTYQYVKNVAEEVRAFSKENNYAIWSATQSNRSAGGKSDMHKSDTSESYGLPQTLDLFIGIFANDDMKNNKVQIWKNLKDRYTGSDGKKFVVSPNFSTATTRDFTGDTSSYLDELEEVRRDKRIEKIANQRDIFNNKESTTKVKDKFKDLLLKEEKEKQNGNE